MMTVVHNLRIAIIAGVIFATLSNCEINREQETNTDTLTNNYNNYKHDNAEVPKNMDGKQNLNEGNQNHHAETETEESGNIQKREIDGLTLFLALVCTSILLCLLILMLTRCFQSYFQKPGADRRQVVFHRVPTGFTVMPGHIVWQTCNDIPIVNAVSVPIPEAASTTNVKVTQQSVATPFQPQTPPPPYRETTTVII